jgi:hypothetical protein
LKEASQIRPMMIEKTFIGKFQLMGELNCRVGKKSKFAETGFR